MNQLIKQFYDEDIPKIVDFLKPKKKVNVVFDNDGEAFAFSNGTIRIGLASNPNRNKLRLMLIHEVLHYKGFIHHEFGYVSVFKHDNFSKGIRKLIFYETKE